ncbi:MAG: DUF4349 domain-containing protein [Thiotrichaceae bacterium]|nr:DUF4349 domain-containing protein [Thiotrichaceae bacterium]
MSTLSIKKKLLFILAFFILLFLMRLVYGYITYPNGYSKPSTTYNNPLASFELSRKNYASKKMLYKTARQQQVQTSSVDQKYEKVGSLSNTTKEYDKSEKTLYQLIQSQELMIQLEQRSGLAQARRLNIALGVIPDKFESIIEKLKAIGEVKRIQIDKKDKTNEYNKLEAKRVSLQKARDSLVALKQSGGSVSEMIELTNRLLVIENQIQDLGVSLGEFDEKNEFCTVKFTLKEVRKPVFKVISLAHRLNVAITWTAQVFIVFWVLLSLGLVGIWLILAVFTKAKKMVKNDSEPKQVKL